MLHLSKSVEETPKKKKKKNDEKTNLDHFQQIFVFGWTISLGEKNNIYNRILNIKI